MLDQHWLNESQERMCLGTERAKLWAR